MEVTKPEDNPFADENAALKPPSKSRNVSATPSTTSASGPNSGSTKPPPWRPKSNITSREPSPSPNITPKKIETQAATINAINADEITVEPSKKGWSGWSPWSTGTPSTDQKPTEELRQTPLTAKEIELKKKEAELVAREKKLNAVVKNVQKAAAVVDRKNNFPPCWPMMYHNIKVDIPENGRSTVRWLYGCWMFLFLVLILNASSCLAILVSHASGVDTGGKDFGGSLMYCVGIPIASFFLWYKPAYRGYCNKSSFNFYMFFSFSLCHILFCFYMAIGIPGSGSAGIINSISMLSDDKVLAGILCCINSGCWILLGLIHLALYRRTHNYYRNEGLTAEDARNEAVSGVAASGVTKTAMSAYFKSNTGSFA